MLVGTAVDGDSARNSGWSSAGKTGFMSAVDGDPPRNGGWSSASKARELREISGSGCAFSNRKIAKNTDPPLKFLKLINLWFWFLDPGEVLELGVTTFDFVQPDGWNLGTFPIPNPNRDITLKIPNCIEKT